MTICTCNTPVLGAPVSIVGRSSQLQDSGPSLCPGPMPQGVPYVRRANLYIRNTMPIRTRLPRNSGPGLSGWGYAAGQLVSTPACQLPTGAGVSFGVSRPLTFGGDDGRRDRGSDREAIVGGTRAVLGGRAARRRDRVQRSAG